MIQLIEGFCRIDDGRLGFNLVLQNLVKNVNQVTASPLAKSIYSLMLFYSVLVWLDIKLF